MLRLITGRAGTGKTALVMEELHRAVEERRGGRALIVPEQYSHEAERELCSRCGDALSLYAEVFSFTALARRLMSRLGGGAAEHLDKGGRLLCMALALGDIGSRLKIYGAAGRKAELQALLLRAVDEMRSACVTPDMLFAAAENCKGELRDKLSDLALVAEAYAAVIANGYADPADALTVLSRQIPESDLGPESHIYVDGFIDFTRQEQEVLSALLQKGVQLTVCLTIDDIYGENEVFELSRAAGRRLIDAAKELGTEVKTESCDNSADRADALDFFADNMFSYSSACGEAAQGALELWRAESPEAECEFAAAKALELVRTGKYRWRDIAIAVRGFDDYRRIMQSVFRHYGVPLFVTRKSELLQKPLPSLISGAFDILNGGWDVDDVISYMGTGLTGLDAAECDMLKNYIFKWQLRGGAWERNGDWRQHPDGYGGEYDDDANARLETINLLRRRLAVPLLALKKSAESAETAAGQAAALSDFLRLLELPRQLAERSAALSESGNDELAAEYSQLWDILISALEQCGAILGETPMDLESFGRLFCLMLSKYDVGTIPVSLDRVSAGDFDRMRRRSIKALIVLGAGSERLPMAGDETGVFSDDERRRLLELGLDLGGAGEGELWREFSLIYNCLTLPSEKLIMSVPEHSATGEEQRPSFIFNRAQALFDIEVKRVDMTDVRMSAAAPALTLAAQALRGGTARERSAAEYFSALEPERCKALAAAANMERGRLSPLAVEALYGKNLKLSASRVDRFAQCKFAYFCQYGLKAKTYEPAGFKPPEIGTFMHDILENTAREVKSAGGFNKAVSDEKLGLICDKYVAAYVKRELNDFQEKSPRFIYLFKRLAADVRQVVSDMADELRRSAFEPLSFELDFAKAGELPPLETDVPGESVALTGIADRVDGWLHDGKLYLRVVDYKTGKKAFSLSDVWYGMGLQLLMYLSVLGEDGEKLYGSEPLPAGVMYVPARNVILSAKWKLSPQEAAGERDKELKRSGIVLDDEALIAAWENGEDKRYIPIKYSRGKPTEDSLASTERLGLLTKHVKKRLGEMAGELHRGSIAADPYFRSQTETACLNCDFYEACWFKNGENGESCRKMPGLSPAQVWNMLEGGEDNG